jgi:hypothetical protein
MSQPITPTIIHVVWEGPFKLREAVARTHENDYGLYQIYGTHAIFGPDALLYVGQANARPFRERLSWYVEHWEPWESSAFDIYLGRLGDWAPVSSDHWGTMIDNAEAITIFKMAPPYNSSRIRALSIKEPTNVLNHRRRHRLPNCVSNLDELIDLDDPAFKLYGPPGHPIAPPDAIEEERKETENPE